MTAEPKAIAVTTGRVAKASVQLLELLSTQHTEDSWMDLFKDGVFSRTEYLDKSRRVPKGTMSAHISRNSGSIVLNEVKLHPAVSARAVSSEA